MALPVQVKKSGPGLKLLRKQIETLRESDVLIGIPASNAPRPTEPLNNATLLYLQSEGSPRMNIPPRPVLEPSIEANRNTFTPHMGKAAQAVLQNRPDDARRELQIAGVIASNGAKRYVLAGHNLTPNAPSTIAQKHSDRPLVDKGEMVRAITWVVRESHQETHRGEPAEQSNGVRQPSPAQQSSGPVKAPQLPEPVAPAAGIPEAPEIPIPEIPAA